MFRKYLAVVIFTALPAFAYSAPPSRQTQSEEAARYQIIQVSLGSTMSAKSGNAVEDRNENKINVLRIDTQTGRTSILIEDADSVFSWVSIPEIEGSSAVNFWKMRKK